MRRLLIVALALATSAVPGAARELHWRELDVDAVLQADGTLAVSETHAMVFTGDWNGGERKFWIRLGQGLDVDAVSRRDAVSGEWVRLERGALADVDHWDLVQGQTLRWRSRQPSDPPFEETEIVYRIDYRLTGVLRREGDVWRLDHDFAFTDHDGEIARFVLDFELAPEWQAIGVLERQVDEGPLPPGQGRAVSARLRYVGAGAPAHAAAPRPSPLARGSAVAVAACAALVLLGWALRRERASGRLAPLPGGVDRAFLDTHLFALAPEEAGAAWDGDVGPPEVAAVLARMQLEGKLASRVEVQGLWLKPKLRLTLLAERTALSGLERQLVKELFPRGNETDMATLLLHYKDTGFDPAATVRRYVEDALRQRGGFNAPRRRPTRAPSALLIVAGAALLGAAVAVAPAFFVAPLLLALALVALWVPAFVAAFTFRQRVTAWGTPFAVILVSQALALGALGWLAGMAGQSALGVFGGVVLFAGFARTVATAMQSRQGDETIARRRELAAARRWLAAELERPAPQLADAWTPYLIALGLAPGMDRWFRAHGRAAATTDGAASWSGGGAGSSASGGSGGWTGGGGAFGGAGATASWALAATSMSTGVAAASSDGGGGGGGSSSGGGGGGGW